MKHCLCLLLTLSVFVTTDIIAQSGEQILQLSDKKIIPDICRYRITLKTIEENGKTKVTVMNGYKKFNLNNVMIVKEPRRVAGSVHLRKSNVIWSYYTTNYKIMKISYQSTFMGSLLSYGDIMATELSFDYKVLMSNEGTENYVLMLTPKDGHEGYAKIKLIINKKTMEPVIREYYALSGILLKTSEVKSIRYSGSNVIYLEQEFYEATKARKTIVIFDNIQIMSDVPDRYFNENYMKNLSGE